MRRVVVTGIGSVNAFGAGVPCFVEGLRSARCAIGEMTLFPADGYRTSRAAMAPEVDVTGFVPPAARRKLSRTDRMGLVAAREAWSAARLDDARPDPSRVGVAIGGTTGGMFETEEWYRRRVGGEVSRLPASRLLAMPVHATADAVATLLGYRGYRLTIATACSSSLGSIALAADAIEEGRADLMVAGGAEGHCRMTFAGFNALQAVDPEVCRPFDRRRAGLSLGEGAAILILESEAHARARDAEILARIGGYGMSADAWHMTAPDPQGAGAALAMRRALDAAGLAPDDVEYVNAHGTGTPQNDPIETRAIRNVFGLHASRLAVSSTKSQVGHCLGAAGAIETAATILGMLGGFLPPTVNLEEPDPECDLDYVARAARSRRIGVAITNSYGFGGNNASLVLRAADA